MNSGAQILTSQILTSEGWRRASGPAFRPAIQEPALAAEVRSD